MKNIDLTKIYHLYKGKWVVFGKENRVVAANNDLKKAIAQFKKKNPKAIPDVFRVPTKITPYIGKSLR